MSRPQRPWLNVVFVMCTAIGLVVGGIAGGLFPVSTTYRATAQIAMVPGASLTTADTSAYWEVLTQGQVSRTAAAIFSDPRWLASAASAAGVGASDFTLTAGAIPDTTMVSITADAPSARAAEAAVDDVLNHAMPEVTTILAPFQVRVVSPPTAASPMTTSRTQLVLAGALGGLLLGAAAGIVVSWLRSRRGDT